MNCGRIETGQWPITAASRQARSPISSATTTTHHRGKSKTRFSATMHQLPTSMTRMPSIGLPICKRRAPHRHRYRNSPTPSPPRHADPDRRFRCHDRQSHRGDRRYPDRAGLCNPEVPSGEGLGTGEPVYLLTGNFLDFRVKNRPRKGLWRPALRNSLTVSVG
jgi:hypothetical protein